MNNIDAYKFQAMHVADFSEQKVQEMTKEIKQLIKDTPLSFDMAIKELTVYMVCNDGSCEEVIGHLKGLINYMEMEGF